MDVASNNTIGRFNEKKLRKLQDTSYKVRSMICDDNYVT